MTTGLLPELAVGAADALNRAVERGDRGFTGSELEVLVKFSRQLLDVLSAFRSDALTLLERGAERKKFKADCERAAVALNGYLGAIAATRAYLERLPAAKGHSDRLASLRADEGEALDIRQTVAGWLDALNRPFPSVDLERLRRGVSEAEAGQGENVADVLKSLAAGDA